ncbi:MAG TPA: hypothetical protein VF623_16020 [Segetibacter sp.]
MSPLVIFLLLIIYSNLYGFALQIFKVKSTVAFAGFYAFAGILISFIILRLTFKSISPVIGGTYFLIVAGSIVRVGYSHFMNKNSLSNH